jgi:hypothetical protein
MLEVTFGLSARGVYKHRQVEKYIGRAENYRTVKARNKVFIASPSQLLCPLNANPFMG